MAAGDLPTPDKTKVHDWGDGATEATATVLVTEAIGDNAAQPQPTKAAEPQSDAAAEVETGAEVEAEAEASAHEQWHTQRPLSIQLAQPDDEWREAAVSSPTRSPSLGAAEPPTRSPVPSVPIETTQSVGELALSEETIDLSDQGEPDQCDSVVGSTPWTEDGFHQQQAVQQQFEEQHLAQQQQLEREELEEQELERQLAQHQLEQQQLKQQLREMQHQRQLEQQQLEQELRQQQLVQELERELEQQLDQQQSERQPGKQQLGQQQHKQQLNQQAESFPIIDLFKQQQLHQQNEFVQTPESLKKKRYQSQQRQQPQHPRQSQQQNESVSIFDSIEEQQSERHVKSFPIINLVKLQHMQRGSESTPTTDSSGKQTVDSPAALQQRRKQDELFPVNETLAQRQFKEQNELFRETYFFEQEQLQQQKESSRTDDYTHRRHSHHVDKQQRRQHTEPLPVTNYVAREQNDVLFSGHARVPSYADARKSSASASAADVRRRAEETRRRAGDQWSREEQRVMQEELLLQKQLIQARNGSDAAGAALVARDSWSDLELAPTATSSRPKRTSQPFTRPANRTQSMVVRINRSTSSRSRSKPVYSNFCVII